MRLKALQMEFIVLHIVVNRSNFHRNLICTCPSTRLCLTFFYLVPRWFFIDFWSLTQEKNQLCCRKSTISKKFLRHSFLVKRCIKSHARFHGNWLNIEGEQTLQSLSKPSKFLSRKRDFSGQALLQSVYFVVSGLTLSWTSHRLASNLIQCTSSMLAVVVNEKLLYFVSCYIFLVNI